MDEETIYDCVLGEVVPISEASNEGIKRFLRETPDDGFVEHNLIMSCILELEKREKSA